MVERVALLLFALALGGCGAGTSGGREEGIVTERYEATATVLQRDGATAYLCLHVILASYPPQCGDVPIVSWDWDAVEGEEHAHGVAWGRFQVVGNYDGTSFTVVRAGPAPSETEPEREDVFAPPCPAPAGGWAVADASRVAEDDWNSATSTPYGSRTTPEAGSRPSRIRASTARPRPPSRRTSSSWRRSRVTSRATSRSFASGGAARSA